MDFITRCVRCGDQNQLGDDERSSIQLYFHKGSPSTLDLMVIYCENCGNKLEIGISWPLDILTEGTMDKIDNKLSLICFFLFYGFAMGFGLGVWLF